MTEVRCEEKINPPNYEKDGEKGEKFQVVSMKLRDILMI
jgi:hypothetical protein